MTPEQAKALCIKAHEGQWRRPRVQTIEEQKYVMGEVEKYAPEFEGFVLKNGNLRLASNDKICEAYSSHPIAVAEMMTTDEEKIVAYLHDVLEDTNLTVPDLLTAGCSTYISTSILRLTKLPEESYEEYLENLSKFKISTKVKLADMFHNISDNPSDKSKAKYFEGIKYLLSTL